MPSLQISDVIVSYIALSSILIGIVALVFSAISLKKSNTIRKKIDILMSGKDAKSLEDTILGLAKQNQEMDKEIQELFEISNQIHKLAFKSIHKIGLIRFNPFKDVGGNQSFSLALLDGNNTGITLSSLHTREGNHVYLKSVTKGISDQYPLTEEEKKAIKMASPTKSTQI